MNSMSCETAFESGPLEGAPAALDRLAAWAARRPASLGLSCIALICCLLGLAGSSFDYSLAAASANLLDDGAEPLVWSKVIGDMALASAASIGIGALMLALSAWTAPQAMVEIIRPQPRRPGARD